MVVPSNTYRQRKEPINTMDTSGSSLLSKWSIGSNSLSASSNLSHGSSNTNQSSLIHSRLAVKTTTSLLSGLRSESSSKRPNQVAVGRTDDFKRPKLKDLKSDLIDSRLQSKLALTSQLSGSRLGTAPKPTQQPLTRSTAISSLRGTSSLTSGSRSLLSYGLTGSLSAGTLSNSSLLSSRLQSNIAPTTRTSASLLTSQSNALNTKSKDDSNYNKKMQSKAQQNSKMDYSDMEYPSYDGIAATRDTEGGTIHMLKFTPPEQDPSLMRIATPLADIQSLKTTLVNAVSGSLICAPDFKEPKDATRLELCRMAERVATYDAEFILKVALYTRNELNIRTTANFLLAFASNSKSCRPYLKKYFCRSIRLPSDWIDVAEQYQAFHDKTLHHGSLPSTLRKAMISKFPDFDGYQLGKYNKESSVKKKQKALKDQRMKKQESGSDSDDSVNESSDSESEEELERLSFTLKQLIRKLHISEPVDHVMCLVGKKYPETLEEFYKMRLPGTWEEEKAGKRMKLPTPETWETQVSMKGNKAKTWEDLIDHKKLPFMAMLRNLRNLIQAGISQKHHNWVLKKLSDQGAVVNSRQFPFRFFSAYEVIGKLKQDFEKIEQKLIDEAMDKTGEGGTGVGRGRGGARGRGRGGGGRGGKGRGGKPDGEHWFLKKKKKPREAMYTPVLLDRYRKALDTAVKIATVHNITPIKGRTIIFCDLRPEMFRPCTAARGLGKPRQIVEVAVLLGLMCKHSCEESELIAVGTNGLQSIELEKGTILNNMESVLGLSDILNSGNPSNGHPMLETIKKIFRDRLQVDNMIVLSNEGGSSQEVDLFLERYRFTLNPNLLFVNVNLGHKTSGFEKSQSKHPNDIYVTGYSDQILRFIAERGSSGQLNHLEKIDQKYGLRAIPVVGLDKELITPRAIPSSIENLPVPYLKPRWQSVRVFISSTFRDMHGERDLLTRFVFPELRARCKKHFVDVHEVDLRWGVTEEITRTNKTLELCLSEISRCQLFVGLLGERYGWIPDSYNVPDIPEYQWLKDYPSGRSVTDLEMQYGALNQDCCSSVNAFFFLRDHTSFESNIPKAWKSSFVCENADSHEKMEALKDRIRTSGIEVYDGYRCQWGGVLEGKPILVGLEQFGLRVLNNLWTAIQGKYINQSTFIDEESHLRSIHKAELESRHKMFVGRKIMVKECVHKVKEKASPIIVMSGVAGSGKSSVMASVVHNYVESDWCESAAKNLLVHFVGAAPGSTNILATLRRLTHEINTRFNLGVTVPEEFKNLVIKFGEVLKEAGGMCLTPFVVVIDGLDLLDIAHQAHTMEWLPTTIPENVLVLLSTSRETPTYRGLKRRGDSTFIEIGGLDLLDKSTVVRNSLAKHRKVLDESPFNNQMKLLMAKKDANNPLFLSLACEELRVFGVFEKITDKLKSMPHTIPQMLQTILARLEYDLTKELVAAALSLVVYARNGLEEGDLHSLLSYHQLLSNGKYQLDDVLNVRLQPEQMLPTATLSQLLRAIEGFLHPNGVKSGTVLQLTHSHITLAVRQRYLTGVMGAEKETLSHTLLAGYFFHVADPSGARTFQGQLSRAFSELPYHLSNSNNWRHLEACLCNLFFIQRKCHLGLGPQLLEDFLAEGQQSARAQKERNKFLTNPKVEEYKLFVSRNMTILSRHPALIWQQAFNEPDQSTPNMDAHTIVSQGLMTGLNLMQWVNKPGMSDPCTLTLDSFPQAVSTVDVSPDGRTLACGTLDCEVKLFSLATGKEIRSFTGHSDAITSVCFVGGSRLCSASKDCTLSLWSTEEGHRIALMKGHNRCVTSCTSDYTGQFIVSTGWDCGLKIWDGSKGTLIEALRGEHCPLNCVAFHPEGQLIVTGGWDCNLKIWDILHMTRTGVLRGHSSSVRAVAYSPSGRHIASASLDGEVKLWSATNGSQVGNITGHFLPINCLTFSKTGQELITVSDDHKVKVWSGHLGRILKCVGGNDYGPALCVSLNQCGDNAVVGYHDGTVRMFDTKSGFLELELSMSVSPVKCVKFTNDQQQIVIGFGDGSLKALDYNSQEITSFKSHERAVLSLACGQSKIVAGSEDFTASLHSYSSTYRRATDTVILRGHTGPVTSVCFNTDETKVVTGSRDMSLMIWNLGNLAKNPEPETVLNACHADWITSCAWSDISDHIITASNDFNLKLWDVKTGKEKTKFTGHTSSISAVAYKYGCVVSSCNDGSLKVWSHKGTEITTLYGHSQRINSCDMVVTTMKPQEGVQTQTEGSMKDWSMEMDTAEWKEKHDKMKIKSVAKIDKVVVASCSDDGTLRIWQPLEANELSCLMGHSDRVISVASIKDGHIVSSSLDKTIKQWHPTLEPASGVKGHSAEVTAIEYMSLPTGLIGVTACRDGTVAFWSATPSEQDGHQISSLYSWQAHNRGVNSLAVDGSTLVTASDDGTLEVWEVSHVEGKIKISHMKTIGTSSGFPVTQMIIKKLGQKREDTLVIWHSVAGQLDCAHLYLPSKPVSGTTFCSWITNIVSIGNRIYATSLDGKLTCWTVSCNKRSCYIAINTQTDMKRNLNKKDLDSHFLSLSAKAEEVYVGDSKGNIALWDYTDQGWHFEKTKKVHSDAISVLTHGRRTTYSASRDGCLKVWDVDMLQIGQFFTQAPVTSMAVSPSGDDKLIVGDELGNVYFLSWKN